jgi:spore germination protein
VRIGRQDSSRDLKGGAGPEGRPPGAPRGQVRPVRRALAKTAWPALALVAIALVALTLVTNLGSGTRHTLVVAAIPFWNIEHDTSVVLANRKDVNEVSPWIYGMNSSGVIVPQYSQAQAGTITADIAKMRAAHLRVVPSIANTINGNWAYQPIARILHDPALRHEHVAAILALVEREHYAGIDIDYEQLHPGDRQVFTQFITELGAALHSHGKVLSVDVFPQASAAKGQANPLAAAQDYAALGKVADQVRVMGFNYHWATSPAGAVAPVNWVRSVLKYATSQVPASKVILGIPLYGFDWPDGQQPAQTISWLQALRLSRQYHVTASYNKATQAPYFSYTTGGRAHKVWFENEASSRAKFEVVKGHSAGGIYLWMYGYEDPGTWPTLRSVLPTSGPNASSAAAGVP